MVLTLLQSVLPICGVGWGEDINDGTCLVFIHSSNLRGMLTMAIISTSVQREIQQTPPFGRCFNSENRFSSQCCCPLNQCFSSVPHVGEPMLQTLSYISPLSRDALEARISPIPCLCLSCHFFCVFFKSLFVQKVFSQASVLPQDELHLGIGSMCTWEEVGPLPQVNLLLNKEYDKDIACFLLNMCGMYQIQVFSFSE